MAYANTYVLHSTICIFSLEVHCSDTVDWLLHLPLIFSITVYRNLSHQSDKTCIPSFQSEHTCWNRKMKHPVSEVYYKGVHSSEKREYSSLLALHLLTACPSVHSFVLFLDLQSYLLLDMIWYDMIWYNMIWYDMIYDTIRYDMIYDMIWNMIWYNMIYFVNCNWVDTRWKKYGTHLHTNNTQINTIKQNT
jgi:hypothetical protein